MNASPQSLAGLAGRTFAAVIFDRDGTLVDSRAVIQRSWTVWAQRYGVPADEFHNFHGMPSTAIIAQLIPEADRDAAKALIDELEENDVEGVVALPGAVDALSALDDARRAVCTSAHRALLDARMLAGGLPHPRVVVTVEDVTHGKPHPEPFLLAAERLGHDPANCLVVEDATAGVQAAKAAGCAALAVVTTTARERLQEADAIVESLDLVRFVQHADGVRVELA